jgi:hypothetical protein
VSYEVQLTDDQVPAAAEKGIREVPNALESDKLCNVSSEFLSNGILIR